MNSVARRLMPVRATCLTLIAVMTGQAETAGIPVAAPANVKE